MACKIRCLQREAGFTLGEVLLAILYISIAFFAFAALQQRLIYSSWKIEQRTPPREACRADLISQEMHVRQGGKPDAAEQVPGVSPGLYRIKAQTAWTDISAPHAGGIETEQVYVFETYATHRRTAGWQQD
ncbi:hypothetical protein IJT17_04575 [bacterium]|nr:hypothetical protein [bacterium]